MRKLFKLFNLNGLVVATILGFLTSIVMWDWNRVGKAEKRGHDSAVASVNKQTKEKTDAAQKARVRAQQPGAADRLRQYQHCRDC